MGKCLIAATNTGDTMILELPDDVLRRAEVGVADLRMAVAIQLYADNLIDHDDAIRLSGLPAPALNRELVVRGLSVQQCAGALRRRMRRNAG